MSFIIYNYPHLVYLNIISAVSYYKIMYFFIKIFKYIHKTKTRKSYQIVNDEI